MPAPTHPIRIGVIGLSTSGGWATVLLAPILDPTSSVYNKYKLVALATRSAESASKTAEKYASQLGHDVKAYHGASGPRDLAQDPEVDLVVVTVRVGDHKAAVLPAIEAGKDIFVEWPLGKGLKEAEEIAREAEAKGVRAMVGTQSVHAPFVRKVREVIQSGTIGKLVSTSISRIMPREHPFFGSATIGAKDVYVTEANSGASHVDVIGGHLLSAFLSGLGPVASLSATVASLYPTLSVVDSDGQPTGQTVTREEGDQIAFTGLLSSGATVAFNIVTGPPESTPGQTPFRWTINGEQGTVEISGESTAYYMSPVSVTVNGKLWTPEYEWDYPTGAIQRAWEEFAKGEEGEYATLKDAVRVHRVVDAISVSARDGVRVDIQ